MDNLSIRNVKGLNYADQTRLDNLVKIFNSHITANRKKNRYYEGHVTLKEVNLGIALPENISKLEIGCEWGAKTVDVLASRSMFDGFVGSDGNTADFMTKIANDNRLVAEYMKFSKDQLKYGCTFSTLSHDDEIGCKIRFHSPETAAAKWSGEKGRIDYGFAIIDTCEDNEDKSWKPSIINMYTDNHVIVIRRDDFSGWNAEYFSNPMGRPLMEPFIWNATSSKPFGRSRIKYTVRNLIDGYIRTVANATLGLEFSTTPQKYLLGISDEQYDAMINQKFRQYVGSILTSTTNPETGENPVFGQLPQGNIQPHIEMMRLLATQYSAATGLTVTDTGVVSEANPTSAEAILAQSQTLITLAEQLNTINGDALKMVARMALAIAKGCRLEDLSDEENNVIAHFKNPAMPSVGVTADAAIKIASARPEFAQTDIFLEMVGFDQADVRRIKAQEQRARGQKVLELEFDDADQPEDVAEVQE